MCTRVQEGQADALPDGELGDHEAALAMADEVLAEAGVNAAAKEGEEEGEGEGEGEGEEEVQAVVGEADVDDGGDEAADQGEAQVRLSTCGRSLAVGSLDYAPTCRPVCAGGG